MYYTDILSGKIDFNTQKDAVIFYIVNECLHNIQDFLTESIKLNRSDLLDLILQHYPLGKENFDIVKENMAFLVGYHGDIHSLQVLLKHYASASFFSNITDTILKGAVFSRNSTIFKYVFDVYYSVAMDKAFASILINYSTQFDFLYGFQKIYNNMPLEDRDDIDLFKLLKLGCSSGSKNIVKYILQDLQFDCKEHLLNLVLLSIEKDKIDILKFFVEEFKFPITRNNDIALSVALRNDSIKSFEYLLEECKLQITQANFDDIKYAIDINKIAILDYLSDNKLVDFSKINSKRNPDWLKNEVEFIRTLFPKS